jgi:thiamine biosynthesis lipoprotein
MLRRIGHAEPVMGTVVSFDISADDVDEPSVRAAIKVAVEWLHRVDAVFSTYRADSDISRLNSGALSLAECDPLVGQVFKLCSDVARETRGYFSSTFAGRLDPTGLVKGWSVDRASELLCHAGFANHCVNGGGDVFARGFPEPGRAWSVAVTHPLARDGFAAVVEVRDGAVATSGTTERGLHIVNPFTGRPATQLASVTVVGPDLTRADAYATAALAMGDSAREWLVEIAGYEALAIAPDGTGWATPGFARVAVSST